MKNLGLLLLGCFVQLGLTTSWSQNNLSLLARRPYPELLASCWGYAAPDGTEYAIVGTRLGTAIVSLANPRQPLEVAYIPGTRSIWREMRTWKNYAYIVCDACSDGVIIADLSRLPQEVSFRNFKPVVGEFGELRSVHTINIDEKGTMYLNGSNLNNGSPLLFDLNANPTAPVYLGRIRGVYVHDSYARGDTLYTADQNIPSFSVYDIRDKANPILLATQRTPTRIAHNVWLSDNSRYLYVTEETSNAPITAYDLADLNNVKEVFRFNRSASAGTGVIQHNVHTNNDWLVVANYTDGVTLIDAHRPDLLVETGNYDTSTQPVGFNGVWGVYPYFPSGTIIASDIQEGLFILQPNYVRASYLEGQVRDAVTGQLLANVALRISGVAGTAGFSDAAGTFKAGTAQTGAIAVEFSRNGYQSKTVPVDFRAGQTTALNVTLTPLSTSTSELVDPAAVSVFPNPVQGSFQIHWPGATLGLLSVYTATGQELLRQTLHPGGTVQLPTGLAPQLLVARLSWPARPNQIPIALKIAVR